MLPLSRTLLTRGLLPLFAALGLLAGPLAQPARAVSWDTVGQDSFQRTVASGWGSAQSGGAWSLASSGSLSTSVAGGQGVVSGLDAGDRAVFTLPISSTDVHVSSEIAFIGPSDADVFYGWRLRQSADGKSYYAVTYRSNPAGSITLSVSRVANGTSTWLSGVKVTPRIQSGAQQSFEVDLTDSTISARIWQAGTTAPAWQLSANDTGSSKLTSGTAAIDTFISAASSSVTMRHDNVTLQRATTATTPAPAPVPAVPAPTGSRGTTVGSQAYAIPSGATFASPSGSDSAAGTQSAPVKTLTKALTMTPSGGTIVLRAGTYHEAVTIETKVTVQSYPNEAVWLDGSRSVTNWAASGSAWVATGWTASFSSTMGGDSSFYNRFLQSGYPMARFPDQVFVDGTQLRQVASASALVSGTFYVDNAADKLYVGTNPSGKDVRASDLEQAIRINASGVTLQGFGVRRYATPYEKRGTISQDASGGVFRHLVVSDNATIGMALSGADKVIDRVQVERNGLLGIGSNVAHRLKLTNSVVSNNNAEHFKYAPVSGGVKITSANDAVISGNEVSSNNEGLGIWLDAYNKNFTVVNNIAQNNGAEQIEVEISSSGIVANNTATGGETGINIYDSDNIKVFNNEMGGSSLFGLKVSQDARWKTLAKSGFTLKSSNLFFGNNVFGCGKTFQFYARDGETNISADQMGLTFQGNLFSKRVDTSKPTMVGWGLGDNTNITRYETPAALASAKNASWKNSQSAGCNALSDMNADITAAQSLAYPLPSEVATAVGVSSGYRKVGVVG